MQENDLKAESSNVRVAKDTAIEYLQATRLRQ
jgi:hypothetical protein